MHSAANMRDGVRLQRMLGKDPGKRAVLPWEQAGPGRCWRVEFNRTTLAPSFVLQPKRFVDLDLENDGFTAVKTKETRGAVKRNGTTSGSKHTFSTSSKSLRKAETSSGRPRVT